MLKTHQHIANIMMSSSQDLGAIEEMIRMFLEIMNSCITHTVHLNVHLVHVMLCHQEEFEKFRELESFKPILQVSHSLNYILSCISWCLLFINFYVFLNSVLRCKLALNTCFITWLTALDYMIFACSLQ